MFENSSVFVMDILGNLVTFIAPLWIAVIFGVVVGWAWKPKWAIEPNNYSWSTNLFKFRIPWFNYSELQNQPGLEYSATSSSGESEKGLRSIVTEHDLQNLCKLVEEKDGGPAWIQMMDRSTPNMTYQAWRRDQENGPPQYRSRTVFEDASPELVRDFFWDDEFRSRWDDMLIHASTIQECEVTGTMMVQWVRKFPFFCSDREYIIGRRIWDAERTYYCVTKGVPCSSIPRQSKPRRVDLYYSSFFIRAVKSRKDGQLTSCEVLFFHYEDMGIPWEIAKLGVRQGMWGAVKKFDPGLRTYKKERDSGVPLSPCANNAKINTKVTADYVRCLEDSTSNLLETENQDSFDDKPIGRSIPKLLVVGGAIALACTLDQGLVTKAVVFGIARRFGKFGRRL
ncbi:putative START-like domain-containing protein [Medicago truncatula]|uniref:Mammalian STARD2 lipid-binding START domain protein n=2 Tax=Medicago truncatula TaxID=3880 RepID=A0A072VMT6_MEDTR|nr:uncharacterized protein LOC25484577 isoform X1 [Medicago truncatula]KEH42916.1 mammalian STARD2 lipid-binding START domain protein [Medicago truncatula]RHN80517.1 putative START-like domain-containing protein [Medicago truncatula]